MTELNGEEDDSTISCLDHGLVRLVDVMGDDSSVVQAARVSYGKGTKTKRADAALIRYLLAHKHTTPFEMVEYKFLIRCPIFVARQWLRHRTASVNEYSLRYSEPSEDFYVPDEDHIGVQDTENRQGTVFGEGDPHLKTVVALAIEDASVYAYALYRDLVDERQVSRETARVVLPLSAYTEFYWKIDLHNLLHFLQLRLDSHAQYEIRVFAEAIAEMVKQKNPVVWEAFEEYVLHAVTLSRGEVAALRSAVLEGMPYLPATDFDYWRDEPTQKSLDRRRSELWAKFGS